jgi:hypothetical protein
MSLVRYEEVLPWAAGIQREVLERRMPPWSPEEGHLAYRGERFLSATEIDVLADWTAGATPEGDPEAVTEPEPVRPALQGEGVVTLEPGSVRLGPDESEKQACRVVAVPLAEPRWLTGVELRPGAPRSLRRAVIWRGGECGSGRAPLMAWVPGLPPLELPPGSGVPLEPGQLLALQLEYQKTWDDDGRVVQDASQLRLRLAPGPRRAPQHRSADGEPLASGATLLALTPTGAGDERLEVVAQAPEGGAVVLLELRRPEPLWLGRYELAQPLHLPAGTRLLSRGGNAFAELLPDP